MTGNQMFAKLISLRDESTRRHFERVALADQLLKDKDWVESPTGGGGDEDKAINRLEAECFADLCGVVGLPELLDLFHHFPAEKDWVAHKGNVRKMWAELSAQRAAKPKAAPTPRPAARPIAAPAEFNQMSPANQRKEYERASRRLETDEEKIARLEAENAQLKEENAALKQQIKDMKEQARKLIA